MTMIRSGGLNQNNEITRSDVGHGSSTLNGSQRFNRHFQFSSVTSRLFFVTIALLFAIRIYFAWGRAALPFEIDYEEGNVLNGAVAILHHQTPYPHPGSFPYVVNSHGPIGYSLTALGVRLFGLSLFGPRLLVLMGGVLIVLFIALLVRTAGAQRGVAWLFGLVYLCSPLMWNWYPLLRVDLWAILLSLIGIYAFMVFPRQRILCAIIFAAAILTKPTALAAPFACAVELMYQKRFRELLVNSLVFLGILGGCAIWLGPDFRFAMLRTHPDPYSFGRAFRLYCSAFEGALLPVAIFLLALFSGFRWTPSSRLLWIYGGAVCLISLTSGKLGSETNHFLEWTAIVCVLAGLALSHFIHTRNQLAVPLLSGTVLLTGLFAVLPARVIALGREQSECEEAYRFVKSFPGDRILSEDISALILANKPVEVGNPYGVTQLGGRVDWSHGTPDAMVRRREFDLIVLGGQTQNFDPSSGRWPEALIADVGRQYQLGGVFRCYPNFGAVYLPKPTASRSRAK